MNSETLLKNGLTDLGYSYSQKQIHAFLKYLAELKKWNRAYNLTALKADNDIIIKHFLDSGSVPHRFVEEKNFLS
jgi:16S rRNA (guanine527-N7)-methyltransferase